MDTDVVTSIQVDKDVHEHDVADVFASMLEIEIIALRQLLKSTAYQLYLVHPITSRPIAIGLDDIQRRKERCRVENDLPLSRTNGSQSPEYTEIDYGFCKSAKAIQLSCQHRRRCILLSVLGILLTLIVAAVAIVLFSTVVKPPAEDVQIKPLAEDVTLTTDCILLIGGEVNSTGELVEYYNPYDGVECDVAAIGRMSQNRLADTTVTSGCYLTATDEIVIRGAINPNKPPMVYRLKEGSSRRLSLPFRSSSGSLEYTWGSTAAAIDASTCLSCGGWNGGNTYLQECFRFDPLSDPSCWTPIASLPKPLGYAASVAVDNSSYYVIGGWNGTVLREMYRYDVARDGWRQLGSMQEGRQWHSAAPLSATEFLICGGWTWRADCQIYDVDGDEFRNAASLNVGRRHFVLANLNGTVYAIGGEGADYFKLDSVECYNQTTDTWTYVKRLRYSRWNMVAVVV